MSIDLIIFIAILAIGAFVVHWFLKKVFGIVLWVAAIFITYILLKVFIIH